jgi:IclR family pca regulon transcriptional regulator
VNDSAIARTMAILAAVSRSPEPMSAQTIAKATGIPKATAYRALEELAESGWLLQSEESPRRYRPCLRLAELGLAVLMQHRAPGAVLTSLCALAAEVRKVCMFSVYEGGDLIVTDVVYVEGDRVTPTAEMLRMPAAVSGAGKSLLAQQHPDEIERVASKGLPAFRPRTKTTPKEIREAIDEARRRGYGITEDEHDVASGVGGPVFDQTGRAIGTFGVSGKPLSDETFLPAVLEPLLRHAREASAQLGFRRLSSIAVT